MYSTERKYPTGKPWAFVNPSPARIAQGCAQGLPRKSDTCFSNGAKGCDRVPIHNPIEAIDEPLFVEVEFPWSPPEK